MILQIYCIKKIELLLLYVNTTNVMTTNCTFKLAYTTIKFSKIIDFNVTPREFKKIIKNDVLLHMKLHNYNIILAGTPKCEKNTPIDCSIDNVPIKSIIKLYGSECAFYIKKIEDCDITTMVNTMCPLCNRNIITNSCEHV